MRHEGFLLRVRRDYGVTYGNTNQPTGAIIMSTINAALAYDKFVAAAQLSGSFSVDAENAVLSVDRKFLPAFVSEQGLDKSTPATAEYWDWLRSQVEQDNTKLCELAAVQDAARPILDRAIGVDIVDAFERGDWSAVAIALRDSNQEPLWLEARAAILESDPEADA